MPTNDRFSTTHQIQGSVVTVSSKLIQNFPGNYRRTVTVTLVSGGQSQQNDTQHWDFNQTITTPFTFPGTVGQLVSVDYEPV